jgi:hypothetical protein
VIYGVIGARDAARLLARLGPHSAGKGCRYLKRLADVDRAVLETLIRRAVGGKGGRRRA